MLAHGSWKVIQKSKDYIKTQKDIKIQVIQNFKLCSTGRNLKIYKKAEEKEKEKKKRERKKKKEKNKVKLNQNLKNQW